MPSNRPRGTPLRPVLAALVVVAVVVVFATGAHRSVSTDAIRTYVEGAGVWGPVLFVVAYALLQPFGLSAHVFIIAASLLWSPWLGLPLCWVGSMCSTTVSYWFARYIGAAWVRDRLPDRLSDYDERLATRGFRTVVILRLIFFTFAPLQMMFGVSRVRFRDVLTGSAVGLLPWMVAELLLGASVFAWLQ